MKPKAFSRHVDGPTVYAEVRMQRQKHKGAFLILEGGSDARRLDGCIDESKCALAIAYGKEAAIDAIDRIYDDGFQGAVAFVDADFDRCLGKKNVMEGVIFSAAHDLDMDMIKTSVLKRYLKEVADETKMSKFKTTDELIFLIQTRLLPLSFLRYINEREKIGLMLKSLKFEEFFMNNAIEIDDLLRVAIHSSKFIGERDRIKKKIEDALKRPFDIDQITSGHDFCEALGFALRDEIGDRRPAQSWGTEVELHLRLAFRLSDFKSTGVYLEAKKWEEKNKPYSIFLDT
jgi:hypothetical protein